MRHLLLGTFLIFVQMLYSCNGGDEPVVLTVKVGGLYSINGNWSSLGKTSQAAMNLALEDVNKYLEENGTGYLLSTAVFDTELDTTMVKNAFSRAVGDQGIRIFIGPQSSAEVRAIRSFANENEALVISQGSTASSVAIPDDAVFRYCPGDAVEGAAISKTIYNSGKRVLITLARNDAGNTGLQTQTGAAFQALGGQVDAIAPYPVDIVSFSSLVSELKTKVSQYSASLGASKVGVYVASFDELEALFSQASGESVLKSVNWYGGDGVVQSTALLENTVAREFAISTEFFAPNFGLPSDAHPDLERISGYIKQTTGIEPDAYALSVYDIMWVIGKTLAVHKGVLDDFSQLKDSFNQESNQHFGITGPVLLNENGDRKLGSFDYWGIVNENGSYSWKVVGKSN